MEPQTPDDKAKKATFRINKAIEGIADQLYQDQPTEIRSLIKEKAKVIIAQKQQENQLTIKLFDEKVKSQEQFNTTAPYTK